jgi:hypothetical protein
MQDEFGWGFDCVNDFHLEAASSVEWDSFVDVVGYTCL